MSGWTKDRKIMISGSLGLLISFFFPIWKISLTAPQYIEPVEMFIYLYKFSGEIQTVNILNHYVGMKNIPVEMIEFTIFPSVILLLSLLGIWSAWKGRYYLIWLSLFCVVGLIGFVDFYLWEYDYGHNLNPKAPIKIPGQAYQPPLIGKKTILNFTTYSLPYYGSIAFIVSMAASVWAHLLKKKL